MMQQKNLLIFILYLKMLNLNLLQRKRPQVKSQLVWVLHLLPLCLPLIVMKGFSLLFQNLQSSAPVELTEAETEYAVDVVNHIFDRHELFQYKCTNTIPEQLLEKVTVLVDASDAEEFSELGLNP